MVRREREDRCPATEVRTYGDNPEPFTVRCTLSRRHEGPHMSRSSTFNTVIPDDEAIDALQGTVVCGKVWGHDDGVGHVCYQPYGHDGKHVCWCTAEAAEVRTLKPQSNLRRAA